MIIAKDRNEAKMAILNDELDEYLDQFEKKDTDTFYSEFKHVINLLIEDDLKRYKREKVHFEITFSPGEIDKSKIGEGFVASEVDGGNTVLRLQKCTIETETPKEFGILIHEDDFTSIKWGTMARSIANAYINKIKSGVEINLSYQDKIMVQVSYDSVLKSEIDFTHDSRMPVQFYFSKKLLIV